LVTTWLTIWTTNTCIGFWSTNAVFACLWVANACVDRWSINTHVGRWSTNPAGPSYWESYRD
jgi:hypothetical protein